MFSLLTEHMGEANIEESKQHVHRIVSASSKKGNCKEYVRATTYSSNSVQ